MKPCSHWWIKASKKCYTNVLFLIKVGVIMCVSMSKAQTKLDVMKSFKSIQFVLSRSFH